MVAGLLRFLTDFEMFNGRVQRWWPYTESGAPHVSLLGHGMEDTRTRVEQALYVSLWLLNFKSSASLFPAEMRLENSSICPFDIGVNVFPHATFCCSI